MCVASSFVRLFACRLEFCVPLDWKGGSMGSARLIGPLAGGGAISRGDPSFSTLLRDVCAAAATVGSLMVSAANWFWPCTVTSKSHKSRAHLNAKPSPFAAIKPNSSAPNEPFQAASQLCQTARLPACPCLNGHKAPAREISLALFRGVSG